MLYKTDHPLIKWINQEEGGYQLEEEKTHAAHGALYIYDNFVSITEIIGT
jgi:hypothetical protein